MFRKSIKIEELSDIVSFIEKHNMSVAVFLNQSQRLCIELPDGDRFKEKVKRRPFSLVGVYSPTPEEEWLAEDVATTQERYSALMELRRVLSRVGKKSWEG